MSSGLTDQVALVTGGVRGIGLAISEILIAEGVRVAAGFSRNGPAAEAFLEKHADHGASIHQGRRATFVRRSGAAADRWDARRRVPARRVR